MSEFLTIRLGSQDSDPIKWLVWSSSQQQTIASGELSDIGNLSELAQYSQHRQTSVLLPSTQILITQVTIPPKAGRQLNTILPFLMEDEITQDIDSMHFSVLKKEGDQATVASIEKAYLTTWIERFEQAKIEVQRMLPDALALPLEGNKISALHIGEQWLFRKDDVTGASADDDWLDMFLSSGWLGETPKIGLAINDAQTDETNESQANGNANDKADIKDSAQVNIEKNTYLEDASSINNSSENSSSENNTAPQLTIYSFSEPPVLNQEHNIQWQQAPLDLDMIVLSKGIEETKINLLTGEFQHNEPMLQYWKIWKKAVIALLLFVVVLMTNKTLETKQLESQAQSYRAESERIFKTIFPDKKRIPTVGYLKRTMEDEEKLLTGQSGGVVNITVLDWLSMLPPILETAQGIQIQSIFFDSETQQVQLQVEGDDFAQFENFKEKLSTISETEQGPANRSNDKVSGRFILRDRL